MSVVNIGTRKKISVRIDFHTAGLNDTATFMELGSTSSADYTRYLCLWEQSITWTTLSIVQDDDAGGGETYTFRLYNNESIIQTETTTSNTADMPFTISLSPTFNTTKNDVIRIDLKSSNATAGDEVLCVIWGHYFC
jgi:hypothetical protein